MNKAFCIVCCFFMSVACFGEDLTTNSPELTAYIQQFSRQEGYKIASTLKLNADWIDLGSVVQGIQDYIQGKPVEKSSLAGRDFYQITLQLFKQESEKNLQKADAFMQNLAAKAEMHSIAEGKVLYEIVKTGTGLDVVKAGSAPLLQYAICTQDGLEVSSTRWSEQVQKTPLNETVPGFSLGLEGMLLGEKRKIFIHPDLGYGKMGGIPPNSLLIVDVEVLGL